MWLEAEPRSEHESDRGEAATGQEKIVENEPCLPAKTGAAQPSDVAVCDSRRAGSLDGYVGIFPGALQGHYSSGGRSRGQYYAARLSRPAGPAHRGLLQS